MTAVTAFAVQADEWGQPLRLHPDQAESKRTLDVQTDGAGHLWGIVSTKQGRRLARWCEDGWHTVILPTPREMEQDESTGLWIQIGREYGEEVERLLRLVPGPDGTVLASGVHCDFLLLRGDCARWIPRQFAKPDTWTLRMDRRGDAWLLSGDSEMYLVDASSDAEPVLTMAPDYGYLKRYGVRNWSVPDIAVKLVDDGRHRFWALNEVAPWGVGGTYRQVPLVFWPGFDAAQDLTPGDDAPPIFLLDGRHGYWASRGRVLGRRKTPEEIQFIARKDTNTLWFSSDPCGLIELDSATLKVKRPKIQGPAPRYIMHSVFQVGERWYGVCREKPKAPPGPAVLCRFDGVSWHALPLTLDPHDGPHLGIDRPRLATDSGVWLGSGGPAIAFIPRDGTDPVLYDWRYGFRMPRATSIAQTPDGRLLIAHKSEPDTLLSESDLFALETSAQTVNCWWKVGDLLQTADGFIWHASRGGDWKIVLRRLEGSDWRSFDSEYSDCFGVCGDRKNRLWVTSDNGTSVFVPPPPGGSEDGSWTRYRSYRSAVKAEGAAGTDFLPSAISNRTRHFFTHKGDAGDLAFLQKGDLFTCVDSTWRWWTVRKWFLDGTDVPNSNYTGFDSQGRVYYAKQDRYWTYQGRDEWTLTESDPVAAGLTCPWWPAASPTLPDYIPREGLTRVAKDRAGTYWLLYGRVLRKAQSGVCLPVLGEDGRTPFDDETQLLNVFTDPTGNVVLQTGPDTAVFMPR